MKIRVYILKPVKQIGIMIQEGDDIFGPVLKFSITNEQASDLRKALDVALGIINK